MSILDSIITNTCFQALLMSPKIETVKSMIDIGYYRNMIQYSVINRQHNLVILSSDTVVSVSIYLIKVQQTFFLMRTVYLPTYYILKWEQAILQHIKFLNWEQSIFPMCYQTMQNIFFTNICHLIIVILSAVMAGHTAATIVMHHKEMYEN